MIKAPLKTIETERLILRRITIDDSDDLFLSRSHPQSCEYTDSLLDKTIDETRVYIDKMNIGVDSNRWRIWAIEEKTIKRVIGSISIWNLNEEENKAELGFGLHPDYWSKGYMTEALKVIVNYGFNDMELSSIEAYTEENNLKSRNLLSRCGFTSLKTIQEEGYFKKQVFNMVVYVINK